MSTRAEQRIDAMVHTTLMEMIDWSEVETTPENVHLFAANKLDFPVTEEEVEGALQRKLSQELHMFPFDEYDEEVHQDIRRVMAEQHIEDAADLRQAAWERCSYTSLEAVHKVLGDHGSPNLLYE